MSTTSEAASGSAIRSLIPARIDRLPWSPFHTRMVVALGVAWVLDGLEITIAGSVAGVLSDKQTLHMSSTSVGLIATIYLIGEIIGALFFGRLSDKLGRRNLFMLTLGVYLVGSGLTALTWSGSGAAVAFLYLTRIIAGMGIGGEYAAINSAIDELIPARYRGRVDIAVNGTYWGGAIIGTLASLLFLNVVGESLGWRLGFIVGPVLGVVILFVRRNLPESPRWQLMHGREQEAEASIAGIEREVERSGKHQLPELDESRCIEVKPTNRTGYLTLVRVLFSHYPKRSVLGASLMITQSFLYNAIFFTYTLVLTKFYHVSASSAPYFLIAFAVGNLAGPLLIGRHFDTLGRKKMISGTYILSGIMLFVTAWLFQAGVLTAVTQTIAWCVIFFFASAGASAAYLTVSEIFPLEVRAQAIAVFFAIAQGFGALGPVFYGHLIGDGSNRSMLTIGYVIGAAVMVVGGLVEIFLGIAAEQKSLEDIASPLSAVRTVPESMSGLTTGRLGVEGGARARHGTV
jgi:MFS family permease